VTLVESPITPVPFASPNELLDRLAADDVKYLAGHGLAATAFLAHRMRRPLFLEGEPGVGKTSFATAMGKVLGARTVRLQCHGGIDAAQALYDWNFPKQVLTLRALGDGDHSTDVPTLWTEEFLTVRPVLDALRSGPAVLLIDEIDRADDEFEALLLQVLENYEIDIPELGGGKKIKAEHPPFVILTSNRTRDVHDALKRRCVYHWITHPEPDREIRILRLRVKDLSDALAEAVAKAMVRLRRAPGLVKPPGVAESIDLAHALVELGATALTPEVVDAAMGTVAKHHDDESAVRKALLPGQREPS
jgi:MoxR-like ATPase